MTHHRADIATAILAIDHLGLRAADREAMTDFLCAHLGMERTDHTDALTVVRAAGGGAKLVVWDAGGPTEAGVLGHLVLRVADLDRALSALPSGIEVEREQPELAVFQGPEGLPLALTSVIGGGVDYDLDGVVLRVDDPDQAMLELAALGFVPRGGGLSVADRHVRFEPGLGSVGQRPMFSHLGVLVESVGAVQAGVTNGGLELVDPHPPNQLAVVVGTERLQVEYSDRIWSP